MSELAKLLESKGLEVTKDAPKYVRVLFEAVSDAVMVNTFDLIEDAGLKVDKEKTFIDDKSKQIFFYFVKAQPEPIEDVEPKVAPVAKAVAAGLEKLIEPELIPNSTIGIDLNSTASTDTSYINPAIEPEEEIPEEVKEIVEELEE